MGSFGDELPGGRKYEHIIYKSVEGPVSEFLLEFQRQCCALKPHKFNQHECEKRKLLSKMCGNLTLVKDQISIYADYSQNFKKTSGKSGVALPVSNYLYVTPPPQVVPRNPPLGEAFF